jgi:hypothetical protein
MNRALIRFSRAVLNIQRLSSVTEDTAADSRPMSVRQNVQSDPKIRCVTRLYRPSGVECIASSQSISFSSI